ncbi:MAG: 4-hydroxythreonine-4-phosphate dehydrogenase PdxA [Alphaproteobacteria bacterium]|nr:4-hydroxythreonine-4-phosphate dehydrogenase PdxA [Alphaproteobacteria bacterium]MBU0793325.1 4-hydroxythreonine-4-phosphate dehydrogenase PdxA [Alphaproteobacteria bacterium]MBU0876844.1 4-hydroxythreonine-4-phosphate dehydrogenase PdxA [Alphaproteobacteria bacterium]MBU1770411.1 4-hydroxythreonine-4-phosphate dehydrogenase PdxA [Alphaproteobacteria bacterium]
MPSASSLPRPIAISLGDPAGIGPEVIAKAWDAREQEALPPFFVVGDARAFAQVWQGPVRLIGDPIEAEAAFGDALPCLQVSEAGEIVPGQPSLDGARCAFQSLEAATGLVRAESASALVTAPISKSQLAQVGFTHPGQTEFVAERCGVSRGNVVMMLAGPSLRVVPLTIHIPYTEVPEALTATLIRSRALATARGLKRLFGIERPRLAMAGLNPHAGENGLLGDEEQTLITPVLDQLREEGLDISGPHSPDALFTPRARALYDAALCCYHDQALIPIKALDFDEGVNITLGLPIVRTSPDHGTAFDLAGKDQAHPGAMIAAIRMAQQAELNRRAWVDPCLPS